MGLGTIVAHRRCVLVAAVFAAAMLLPLPLAWAQGTKPSASGWSTEVASPKAAAAPVTGRKPPTAAGEPEVAGKMARARATGVLLEGDAQRTRIRLEVSSPITANIYALSNPYRVIADIPDIDFNLPVGSGRHPHGLVTAFRYGLFEIGRSRVVIDAAGPVAIEGARFMAAAEGAGGQLVFDLVRISAEQFAQLEQKARQASLRQSAYDDADTKGPSGPALPPGGKARPVVVIDPGHGGPDPGTVAGAKLTEKDIVLAVGRQLRTLLLAGRRYDVHMTRNQDVFVPLDGRLRLSRKVGADLFVSLHIDALPESGVAQSVRGASIYILSERASDETARRLADKENASDTLAGLESVPSSQEDHVRSILIDLMRRETANYSAAFRGLLTTKLKSRIALSREPQRAAAFKVLKQADTPSVLIELGYMSHPEDRALISKSEWQRQVAASIAEAIDAYFVGREAKAHP
jgi:N-acetylmuramoyl-L-alanine amidase